MPADFTGSSAAIRPPWTSCWTVSHQGRRNAGDRRRGWCRAAPGSDGAAATAFRTRSMPRHRPGWGRPRAPAGSRASRSRSMMSHSPSGRPVAATKRRWKVRRLMPTVAANRSRLYGSPGRALMASMSGPELRPFARHRHRRRDELGLPALAVTAAPQDAGRQCWPCRGQNPAGPHGGRGRSRPRCRPR